MTIDELRIQFDLQHENRINILEDATFKCGGGYLFVDSLDGHCYLFDENGNEDDVKNIKSIENSANCKNLKSIIIPDSVKSIGYYAFHRCESLISIVIPDSVKSIRDYAFAFCKKLESIVIPNFVESIGNYAFYGCKSLKSIIIPDSVKSIGYGAFIWCESLKSVSFKGKTINQIKAMENYPFGIKDESIIKCI